MTELALVGICSVCGCTEDNACEGGCIWANAQATLCSRCARERPLITRPGPDPAEVTMCEACERGDHANCGLQTWCQCNDPDDGDLDAFPLFADPNEAYCDIEE